MNNPVADALETLVGLFASGTLWSSRRTAFLAGITILQHVGSVLLKDGEPESTLQLQAEAPDGTPGLVAENVVRHETLHAMGMPQAEIVTQAEFCDQATAAAKTINAAPPGAEALSLPIPWKTIAMFIMQQLMAKILEKKALPGG